MGRRQKKSKAGRVFLSILVLLVVLAGGAFFGWNTYLNTSASPVNPDNTALVTITIPSGASTSRIGQILVDEDLVRNQRMFTFIAQREGFDGRLRAGEYSISQAMSVVEILEALSVGGAHAGDTRRFTIPEGFGTRQIAQRLENEGFVDAERFLYLIEHGDFPHSFIADIPITGPHRLEGYLFPDTYEVFVGATEEDIISRMLTQFERVFTEEYQARAAELGLTMHEVITIAALVEAETRVAFERPLVAGVIFNRMAINMPLQLDATVQFALGERRERLLFRDIEAVRDHPYNTYHIPGLPPGPICSPGAAAIHATLFPQESEYLFYVLQPNTSGAHNFSRTLAEHNAYARQYHNWLNQQQN